MKNSILNSVVLALFIGVFVLVISSCSKKDTTPAMTNFSYTIMSSPDTVKANVPATFTIEVMDMATNMNAAVTNPSCTVTGITPGTMPITMVSAGVFTGQYTFTTMGTATLKFACMDNMGMAQSNSFTVPVK